MSLYDEIHVEWRVYKRSWMNARTELHRAYREPSPAIRDWRIGNARTWSGDAAVKFTLHVEQLLGAGVPIVLTNNMGRLTCLVNNVMLFV